MLNAGGRDGDGNSVFVVAQVPSPSSCERRRRIGVVVAVRSTGIAIVMKKVVGIDRSTEN